MGGFKSRIILTSLTFHISWSHGTSHRSLFRRLSLTPLVRSSSWRDSLHDSAKFSQLQMVFKLQSPTPRLSSYLSNTRYIRFAWSGLIDYSLNYGCSHCTTKSGHQDPGKCSCKQQWLLLNFWWVSDWDSSGNSFRARSAAAVSNRKLLSLKNFGC